VRVTTAPGRTTAGIDATGSRVVFVREIVEVAGTLIPRGYRLADAKLIDNDS
jgi:hypothetical protein